MATAQKTIRGSNKHEYDYDFDAAAAEHYMYIRYVAAISGDPVCYVAPATYAVKKMVDQARGKLQSGAAQTGHPVLPANRYIVAWGHKGVVDGLSDYKKLTNGAAYKYGNAVEALASFAVAKETASELGAYATKVGKKLPSR